MIRFESEEHDGLEVGFIVLSRPEKRNALTPDMLAHLNDAAIEASRSCRSLAIVGEGKIFCAGFDLALCADSPDGAVMRELMTGLSTAIATCRALEIPVVVGAHGAAVAGGAALLCAGDIVVADRGCQIGYPVVRLGVSPAVNVPFLRNSLQDGRTRAVSLDPTLVRADHTRLRGLVHELVDSPTAVFERCREIAFQLATKPAGAIAQTKAWMNTLDHALENAERGLAASLSLVGTQVERDRIAAAFGRAE